MYNATTPQILKQHKKRIHEGVRYQCDQCDYSAGKFHTLKCDKCIDVATSSSDFKKHKAVRHKGNPCNKNYQCDNCTYAARTSSLKVHKELKHEGVRHPCDQCEYFAGSFENLKKHKK